VDTVATSPTDVVSTMVVIRVTVLDLALDIGRVLVGEDVSLLKASTRFSSCQSEETYCRDFAMMLLPQPGGWNNWP
jgi:hypothetical protein